MIVDNPRTDIYPKEKFIVASTSLLRIIFQAEFATLTLDEKSIAKHFSVIFTENESSILKARYFDFKGEDITEKATDITSDIMQQVNADFYSTLMYENQEDLIKTIKANIKYEAIDKAIDIVWQRSKISSGDGYCYIHEFNTPESARFVTTNITRTLITAAVNNDKNYFRQIDGCFVIISPLVIPLLAGKSVDHNFVKCFEYIFNQNTKKVSKATLSATQSSTTFITSNLPETNKRKNSVESSELQPFNLSQTHNNISSENEFKHSISNIIQTNNSPPEQSTLKRRL